jgi:hypothetical protein
MSKNTKYATQTQRDFYQKKIATFVAVWQSSNYVTEVPEKLDALDWYTGDHPKTKYFLRRKAGSDDSWSYVDKWHVEWYGRGYYETKRPKNSISNVESFAMRIKKKGVKLKFLPYSPTRCAKEPYVLDIDFLNTLAETAKNT